MYKFISLSASTAVLSSLLIMTACSSSSDSSTASSGGGGGGGVPANAIVLDSSNAEPTVGTSVTTANALNLALAAQATPAIGLKDALALLEPRIESIKNTLQNSGIDIVYGADINKTGNCNVSGTFSYTGHKGGTAPSFTDSGTVTVTNCDDGNDVILNGNFSWIQSWNNSTGDYSDTLSGTFSVTYNGGGASGSFNFAGVDYAETGNDSVPGSETYNISKATFSVDLPGGNGFLVKLTAPIIESVGGLTHCPESGTILITGAKNTTAEGIYNGDGTMTIKANGTVVSTTAPCYL